MSNLAPKNNAVLLESADFCLFLAQPNLIFDKWTEKGYTPFDTIRTIVRTIANEEQKRGFFP